VANPGIRNHFLSDTEVEAATTHAYQLTKPTIGVVESQMEPESKEDKLKQHEDNHQKAIEALKRITSLENGSSKDRFHANVQRIINEFGRHRTDSIFVTKPPATVNGEEMPGRCGPDTGSSEVQIGILTAKIHNLSKALQINRGYKDKHNKRNLRLLLHRRQKLIKYMDRKERGSERWTHMIETLGLTPATWKDQISL
jgi:ribosomal protein S15